MDRADDLVGHRRPLRMERHGAPARSGPERDVHAVRHQRGGDGGIGRDAVLVEQQRPPEALRRQVGKDDRFDGGDRLRREDEPVDLQPPIRQYGRLGLAGEAVARALQPGECPELADQCATARRDRPEDEIVDGGTAVECFRRDESPKPEPDDRDSLASRFRPEPGHSRGHRAHRGLDATRVGRGTAAVAGPRQVDAERRVPGRRQVVGPRPAGTVRAHVVPAPGRGEQHRSRRAGGLVGVVEHAERRVGARPDIDRGRRWERRAVDHRSSISTLPDRLAAVSRPPWSGTSAIAGRRSIRRV